MATQLESGIRRRERRWLRLGGTAVAGVMAAGLLAACGSSASDDDGAKGDNGAGVVRVAIGKVGIIGTLPWALADKGGFFEKNGIKIEYVYIDSGPAAVAALTSGTADSGAAGVAVAIPVLNQSKKLTVLGGTSSTVSNTLFVLADKATDDMAAPFPQNVKALKGRKIGVSALGSAAQQMVEGALKNAGIKPSDVTFIATGVGATQMAALSNGRVDAVYGDPSVMAAYAKQGVETTRVIDFASADSAGPGAGNALLAVNVASTESKKQNPARFKSYCAALSEAVVWAKESKNETKVGEIVSNYLGIPADQGVPLWSDVKDTLTDGITEELWTGQPPWNLNGNPLPDFKTSVDPSCG